MVPLKTAGNGQAHWNSIILSIDSATLKLRVERHWSVGLFEMCLFEMLTTQGGSCILNFGIGEPTSSVVRTKAESFARERKRPVEPAPGNAGEGKLLLH